MPKASLFFLPIIWFCSISVVGQCLTDLRKIYPDKNAALLPDDLRVSSGGDFMVVSSFRDDTTGFANTGAAYLFERTVTGWVNIALLTPSNPHTNLMFGESIAMDATGETIVIGASAGIQDDSNLMYVFQKPSNGWSTMHETERLQFDPVNNLFPVKLSGDGLTLIGTSEKGVYVYKRSTKSQRFDSGVPYSLQESNDPMDFIVGVDVNEDIIIVSSFHNINGSNPASISVYENDAQSKFMLLDKIILPVNSTPGTTLKLKDNLIVCPVSINRNNDEEFVAYVFEKETGKMWSETNPVELTISDLYSSVEILDNLTIVYATAVDRISYNYIDSVKLTVQNISKTGTTWNETTNDIIYSEIMPIGYYGMTYTSWNGSQLFIVSTLNFIGSKYVNSLTSLTRLGSSWSNPIKINMEDKSSNGFNFGTTLVKSGNNLLVGSPNDSEAGPQAGAVDVFSLDFNNEWVKSGKILPPWNSFTSSSFGDCISASDNILAVGASTYGAFRNGYYPGQVYVYKRTGASWEDNEVLQIIDAPDNITSFGFALAVSSKLLAIIGYSMQRNTYVLIMHEWNGLEYTYHSTIPLAEPLIDSPKVVIKNDSMFLFNGLSGFSETQVGLYTKNPSTGMWEVASTFDMDYGGYLTANSFDYAHVSLEVSDNHVFIGLPFFSEGNSQRVGRVYVYSKPQGTHWPAGEIHYSNYITPLDKTPNSYFGFSLTSINNTLLVGAPGAFTVSPNTLGASLRNQAGNLYLYRSDDEEWNSYQQLLQLQGTESNRLLSDQFGMTVASDNEYYFIGAPFENNSNGAEAGAVYIFPVDIKPVQPLPITTGPQEIVCNSQNPITLKASLPGGKWTGESVNSAAGTFNPVSLPNGKYPIIYSYNYSGCIYSFTDSVLVDVIPPITIKKISSDYCTDGFVNLEMTPQKPEWNVSWYFKPKEQSSFEFIEPAGVFEKKVSEEGYYRANIASQHCQGTSNSLLIDHLNNLTLTLLPDEPSLSICIDPVVTLSTTSLKSEVSVTWYFAEDGSTDYRKMSMGESVEVSKSGLYKAIGELGLCESESNPIHILFFLPDSIVAPNVFTPNGDAYNPVFEIKTNAIQQSVKIFNRWGDEVHRMEDNSIPWDGGNQPVGVYFWILNYINCRNEQRSARGWVHLVR